MDQHIYILLCSDDTLYTGYTNDLVKRVKVHNEGKGSKYTRSRLPVKLLYSESFETKSEAQRREYEIKSWSRKKKIKVLGLNV